ncbi:hypothetical protein OR16_09259 [Cupriavidus basilensis OR16]|uniref:Uncharacterized protein n=1 Tax=Cupriavidus basilensis OR16 TaxID=1127483 RepID=H1S2C7_9BURK|nr:hypothetical protein OR16_09259 [Cupriavidus basilensis OR16]
MAQAQDGADLVLAVGQCHGHRHLAVGRQAVALVGHGVFGFPQQRRIGQDFRQAGEQRVAACVVGDQ